MKHFAYSSLVTALFLSIAIPGCVSRRHPDFPKGAIPQPAGTHMRQWLCAQRTKADPDRFAVYLADWRGASTEIAPAAQRQLLRSIKQVTCIPVVYLEPSGDSALDEHRRIALAEFLAYNGVDLANAPDLIVIGDEGLGLRGDESADINRAAGVAYENQMGTIGVPFGGNGGGGFGGGFQGGFGGGGGPFGGY